MKEIINKEPAVERALMCLNDRWDEYVNFALGLLSASNSPGKVSERLERKILVDYPDINAALSDCEEVVGNIILDAEKLWIEAEIEKAKKDIKKG